LVKARLIFVPHAAFSFCAAGFLITITARCVILLSGCNFMPLRTAPATLADAESLLLLMQHMQEEDPWSEPFQDQTVVACLSELLRNSAYGVAFLVWNAQTPVAYLVICFDYSLEYRGKGAWIDELFVARSHRGQGVGTQLLDLAESASREHHAQFLHLEVSHGNRAIELYRRRGFVDHQRYLMTKPLRFVTRGS
jgi:GNAT superfamily N-acetyltransferase